MEASDFLVHQLAPSFARNPGGHFSPSTLVLPFELRIILGNWRSMHPGQMFLHDSEGQ